MTQTDIVKIMSIKLGPALKIFNSILMFKAAEKNSHNELWRRWILVPSASAFKLIMFIQSTRAVLAPEGEVFRTHKGSAQDATGPSRLRMRS